MCWFVYSRKMSTPEQFIWHAENSFILFTQDKISALRGFFCFSWTIVYVCWLRSASRVILQSISHNKFLRFYPFFNLQGVKNCEKKKTQASWLLKDWTEELKKREFLKSNQLQRKDWIALLKAWKEEVKEPMEALWKHLIKNGSGCTNT